MFDAKLFSTSLIDRVAEYSRQLSRDADAARKAHPGSLQHAVLATRATDMMFLASAMARSVVIASGQEPVDDTERLN